MPEPSVNEEPKETTPKEKISTKIFRGLQNFFQKFIAQPAIFLGNTIARWMLGKEVFTKLYLEDAQRQADLQTQKEFRKLQKELDVAEPTPQLVAEQTDINPELEPKAPQPMVLTEDDKKEQPVINVELKEMELIVAHIKNACTKENKLHKGKEREPIELSINNHSIHLKPVQYVVPLPKSQFRSVDGYEISFDDTSLQKVSVSTLNTITKALHRENTDKLSEGQMLILEKLKGLEMTSPPLVEFQRTDLSGDLLHMVETRKGAGMKNFGFHETDFSLTDDDLSIPEMGLTVDMDGDFTLQFKTISTEREQREINKDFFDEPMFEGYFAEVNNVLIQKVERINYQKAAGEELSENDYEFFNKVKGYEQAYRADILSYVSPEVKEDINSRVQLLSKAESSFAKEENKAAAGETPSNDIPVDKESIAEQKPRPSRKKISAFENLQEEKNMDTPKRSFSEVLEENKRKIKEAKKEITQSQQLSKETSTEEEL